MSAEVCWRESPHYVYECQSMEGVVYVGCTNNPEGRLKALRRESWWTPDTEMLVVAAFANRRTAYRHENSVIRELRPAFNKQGNPNHHAKRTEVAA